MPSSTAAPSIERPAASIVIATHNYARFLPEAIESVQAQSFEDWECIVVDDGSVDETPAVLQRLVAEDDRVRAIRQEQSGPAAARNRALSASRGRYIQFLDADDQLGEHKLRRHVEYLEANSKTDIVYGPTAYFDDGEPDVVRRTHRDPSEPEPTPLVGAGLEVVVEILAGNPMTIEAPLIRASVFEDVGRFDESKRRMEDWEFWVRVGLAGKSFAYLDEPDPVALVRVHGSSLSHSKLDMLLAEIPMRRRLQSGLTIARARSVNERHLREVSALAGIMLGKRGQPRLGLRLILPSAVAARRPILLAWAFTLAVMSFPGGRRLVGALRARRAGAARPSETSF